MSAHVKRLRKLVETGATSWGLVEERADLAAVLDEHERMREALEEIIGRHRMWSHGGMGPRTALDAIAHLAREAQRAKRRKS